MALSIQRKSIYPAFGDNWQTIGRRELPEMASDDAVAALQSWNLHVFMRASSTGATDAEKHPVLPSDIIFIEAPL